MTGEDLVARGVAARDDGDRVGALAVFEGAIAEDPANANAQIETAITLLGLGLVSLAGEAMARAVALRPDLPRADLVRGRIAAQRGDAELALQCFMKAIAESPRAPHPYVLAAQRLRVLGRYRDAAEIVSQGLEQCGGPEAGNVDLLEERAINLVALGLVDDGRESIRSLLTLRKGVYALWGAVLVLTGRKEFAEALELVDSLESDLHRSGAGLAYKGCIDAIRTGRTVFESSRSQVQENPAAELLGTSPYVFRSELPIDAVQSLTGVKRPTKCYVLDDSAASSPAHELTQDLSRLLDEDFALLEWKPGRPTRQICFQYLIPDCFVYDNAGLDPHHTVVTRRGEYAPGLVTRNATPVVVTKTALWDPGDALEPIDCAFVTPSGGWLNYGHVVVDILSTLAIYERLGLSCPIIVPGRVGTVHAELIRASGIADETPVLTATEIRGRLLRLAVCPQAVSAQVLRDWCAALVERTTGASPPPARDKLLYVSRANSARRRLVNEEELEDMLRTDWGCHVVRIQDLPHAAQLQLVQQARLVIGPHGAGLTSTLFAPRGAPLIELLPTAYAKRYYAHLAAVSGRLYLPVFGPAEQTTATDERDLRWRIDLEKVARVLDAALAETSGDD